MPAEMRRGVNAASIEERLTLDPPSAPASPTSSGKGKDGSSKAWRLVTIPCSHYCDKARWALDVAGHPYEEDSYPPAIHLFGTVFAGLKKSWTPQLVSPDRKQVLGDSSDILRWTCYKYPDTPMGQLYPAGLEEEVTKWETLFNRRIGPQARVIAYYHLFQDGPQAIFPLMRTKDMPAWRTWAFRSLYPMLKPLMRSGFKINAANAEACTATVRAVFAEVSNALSDGRPFIVAGSTAPTAADITFAALAAPLIGPSNMGGKLQLEFRAPSTRDWPGTELSVTRAGKHVHKMYEQYRMPEGQGWNNKGFAPKKLHVPVAEGLMSGVTSPIGTGLATSPHAA